MNAEIVPHFSDDYLRGGGAWRLGLTTPIGVCACVAILALFAFVLTFGLPPPQHFSRYDITLLEPPYAPPKPPEEPAKPRLQPKPISRKPAVHLPAKPVAPPPIAPSTGSGVVTSSTGISLGGLLPPSGTSSESDSGVGSGIGAGAASSGARAVFAPRPEIPDDMRDEVFETEAIALFKIDRDGKADVTLEQPTASARLNQVLLATLRKWRFEPAIVEGVAVDSKFEIRIPIAVE